MLDLRGGLKNSCDVYFYEVARRTGIDRIAAMANRLGLGVELELDLPGQRPGLIPTREWRISQGHAWNMGDTIVSGIGQGFIQVTPLQLATYASRIASGRLVQPHLTRKLAGVLQPGAEPEDWPVLGMPEKLLHTVREGMWAVVNEPGGTAPLARLADPQVQLAGKTGSAQVRRVSRELRESGHFDSEKLPWEYRPHALFVAYAPYDAPRYALSVVIEHGNAGAAAAAPMARDIMTEVLRRDPANRTDAPPAQVPRRQDGRDGPPAVARAVVRPDGQGAPGQLAVCAAAVLPGRRRLRRAVQRRRRRAGTLRDAPRHALRGRRGHHAGDRPGRYPVHRQARLAGLARRRRPAGPGAAHGPCRQGRAALARTRRPAAAAVGADEAGAGAGAGRPGSTARRGSGWATRCS